MTSRIRAIDITPVAFRDPPLLNNVGVHQPFALRSIVQVHTEDGITGLGECHGGSAQRRLLENAADRLLGRDIFDLQALRTAVSDSLQTRQARTTTDGANYAGGAGIGPGILDRIVSPFEVAALDAQGRSIGRSVSELLGGAVRQSVAYSGYAFYKWAAHPGQTEDDWGAALDPAGLVDQVARMVEQYGFTAIKVKGGVFPPEDEVTALHALGEAFPDLPLRLDPNAAWTPSTSIRVAERLAGVLEYLEDPTAGIDGMATVAAALHGRMDMPLATNMCVVAFEDLPTAIAQDAVQVVLSDLHLWGGLRRSQDLARICDVFGVGLSMHSNSHLGISLAAMTHLAAATPNLDYACDTHWPWKKLEDDVIAPGVLSFNHGSVPVPTGPGLGVELDPDALERLHRQYLDCGIQERDDTTYMRWVDPSFTPHMGDW